MKFSRFISFFQFYNKITKELPRATNIFGIYPGTNYGTPEDEPFILGAHWDTMDTTDGYNDNGSGVAALIEIGEITSTLV